MAVPTTIRVALAAGALLLTGAAPAPSPSPSTPYPSGVAAFVRDLGLTRYAVAVTDLNGDRRPEALVYAMATTQADPGNPDMCGSGGCRLFVLSLRPEHYRVVTGMTITRPPIRVLPTVSHGWHDIAVLVAGGGIIPGYEARLRFDGRRYPANPAMPPATRLRGDPGKVVIAAMPPPPPGQ